jgi:OOP family OmpA-OmpF porin
MNKLATLMLAASAAMAGSAFAQSAPPYAPLTTDIQAKTPYSAYVQDARGVIARNPFGLCWRTGYWTPADAVPGCDAPLCVRLSASKTASASPRRRRQSSKRRPCPCPAPHRLRSRPRKK